MNEDRIIRREAIVALVMVILTRWGLRIIARQLANDIVDRLAQAGYLKGLD